MQKTILQLRLLAGAKVVQVTAAGETAVPDFASLKVQAILFYLAVTGRPASRQKLIGLLWPDVPQQKARTSLRSALYNLQRALPDALDVTRKQVSLSPACALKLDMTRFEADIEAQEMTAVRRAVALYAGDFLEGFSIENAPEFDYWRLVEQERLRHKMLTGLTWLIEQDTAAGNLEQAAQLLRRLLALEPWREEAHRRLLLLLARQGDYEAALAQFDRCRELLVAELNVEPMPETVSLYERVRSARTLPPKQLPPQPTPFVGRIDELAQLQQWLLTDDARLVTIVGLGGVGKTRLALALAASMEAAFLEGVYFVPLAAVTGAEGLFTAVAKALTLKLHGRTEPDQQIAEYLQEKEALLILDNFEQLADKAAALELILTTAPQVKLLVTSRERLHLRWERPFPLTGMPGSEPNTILQSPAGQLFRQTAVQARPDFTADEADRQAIHQICQMVEGLPLGIELAAAWTRLLPCAQIAAEMNQDHTLLAASQLRGPERQRSLRATFAYSWRMLSEDEQAVFTRLSVFQGGFGRQAAQAVAIAPLRTLSALVDKSLLRVSGDDRYQMHELLRQFAAEKLAESPNVRIETEAAHGRTSLEWLAGQETNLKQAGLEKTADAIQSDWDNIRCAWQWAIEQRRLELIDHSLTTLYEFCSLRQLYKEGKALFSLAATAVAQHPGHESLLARLRLALGAFYDYLGMTEESLSLFRESEPILRQANLKHEWALNLMWTGFSISYTGYAGRLSEGEKLLQRSLAIFEAIGDRYYQARCWGNLGNNLANQGDHLKAWQMWQRSLVLFESLGIEWGQAGTLASLGRIAQTMDKDQAVSRKYLDEGLAIARRIDHKQIAAVALEGLATRAEVEGDLLAARNYIQEGLDYSQALGQMHRIPDFLNSLGRIAYQSGQTERARGYFQRSLNLIEQYGYRANLGRVLTNLGILERDRGDHKAAARYFREAIAAEYELEQIGAVLITLSEVAEMERQKKAHNQCLPELLAHLITHPLTTPAIRDKMSAIAERLKVDLSPEMKAAARPLADVIDMVLTKILPESEDVRGQVRNLL
ncbi:MAG: tetratricopeptide repeat protein [Anaerolineales bacterium]